MGLSESIKDRQQDQIQQVRKAYAEVRSDDKYNQENIFKNVKIDGIDYGYVWLRTFTPSWVILLIFVVGVLTLAPKFLEKFGFQVKFERKK